MPESLSERVLSDDFIDEAQVRFARGTTKELARYIEAAVLSRASEQVATLEAERDKWRTAWEGVNTHRNQLRDALAAAESRLADAERRGAREGFEQAGQWLFSTYFYAKATSVEWMGMEKFRLEAERRYPAPAAPAGEQTRPAPTPEGRTCHVGGECVNPATCSTLGPCIYRPAAAPEPEVIAPSRIWLPVQDAGANTKLKVCITQRDAAAMAQMAAQYASRPTQTAEG